MIQTIRVIGASYISNYNILVKFSDGTENVIDFQNFLEKNPHPQFEKYTDLKKFRQFKIERGNLVWGKDWDLIFPVEELYAGEVKN